MALTDCQSCKYLNRTRHHTGDIVCGVAPAYASMWKVVSSLSSASQEFLSLDSIHCCGDFELDSDLIEHEMTLTLTNKQWQQLANSLDSEQFAELLLQLKQQGIEIETEREGWIEVDSSCIDAICYRHRVSVLTIRFHSGSVYQYDNIPQSVFDNLLCADSKGGYFNQYIKDCYPCYFMSNSIA